MDGVHSKGPHIDSHSLTLTRKCFDSIGIDKAFQDQIFGLLKGILCLGNVLFADDNVDGQVGDVLADSLPSLELAANMFGVEKEDLVTAMTKQNMFVAQATIVKIQSRVQVCKTN